MPRSRLAASHLALFLGFALLAGCAASPPAADSPTARRMAALLPSDVVLIGEQHDAPEHHVIEREVVEALAARGRLAALALEMAEEGNGTGHLPSDATEEQIRTALSWNDKAWPWSDYGPAVMAAVRAGVPVLGGNLPRERMKDAMADVSLDAQLSESARQAQQKAVREGHCNLLPESQIGPMTRIQIARDRAMAQAVMKARQPGKTVLLIAGAGHVLRSLGVPQHLPSDLKVATVQLLAAPATAAPQGPTPNYDSTWVTPPLPPQDYCASFRRAA
ncbi:ChaN family lipoprotein [Variovorax arabinosiphilus]|uniref:ChaN family lipoprotein n=1 Tax=Variovorax arabinosiphilus TaxID=3053498 RepID=UPI0025762F57|nr:MULTISPECIES: ChaN family lipoprotein [unclassified Variovorax]MDM0121088.1 ChaN family lipoprotein [Variovorax sp. J2L1-78]MDM0130149.1 ChaN family lipoprotein [Variovorax sp. J2L1-63]MDM0233851.1 ChaN family lipoprotein [Variovorax sp. J2R1-6]